MTLPEDSVPDLLGVVDRLRSFDNFLGYSKDFDNIVLVDHHNDQSLLDFDESCMLTKTRKSKNKGSQGQPVLLLQHDGILERILAKSAVPTTSTTPSKANNEETLSSIPSATRSPRRLPSVLRDFPRMRDDHSNNNHEQNHEHGSSNNTSLFSIEEESDHKKTCQRNLQGRQPSNRHHNELISHQPTSPRSPSKLHNKKKSNEMVPMIANTDTTQALRTEDQEMQSVVPKVASSPRSLSRVLEQHQRRRDKVVVDPLSPRSLHSEDNASRGSSSSSSSKRPHSRQGLVSSTGRPRSHKGNRRVSKYQELLSRLSEPVSTSKEKLVIPLESASSSNSIAQSSSNILLHQEEEACGSNQEQSHRAPTRPGPRPVRRSRRNASPQQTEVKSTSRGSNNEDEKKRKSHRSPHPTRTSLSVNFTNPVG